MTQQTEGVHSAQPQGVAARPSVFSVCPSDRALGHLQPRLCFHPDNWSVGMLLADSTQERLLTMAQNEEPRHGESR